MQVDDCFYLGYVQKTIGNKGELAFALDVDSPSSYLNLEHVFVQVQKNSQELVPFFILQSTLLNTGNLRCKIDGIDNVIESKELVGKSLYLPLSNLPALKANQFYFHEIIGFEVLDLEKGKIGTVDKVLEYPQSNLLSVLFKESEILIPITDDSIVNVDRDNKILQVKASPGLIDLYLEQNS